MTCFPNYFQDNDRTACWFFYLFCFFFPIFPFQLWMCLLVSNYLIINCGIELSNKWLWAKSWMKIPWVCSFLQRLLDFTCFKVILIRKLTHKLTLTHLSVQKAILSVYLDPCTHSHSHCSIYCIVCKWITTSTFPAVSHRIESGTLIFLFLISSLFLGIDISILLSVGCVSCLLHPIVSAP